MDRAGSKCTQRGVTGPWCVLPLIWIVCTGWQFCIRPMDAIAQPLARNVGASDPFYLAPIASSKGLPNTHIEGLPQRSLKVDPKAKTLVLITMGQSLMANAHASASPIYVPSNSAVIDNFNIYDGAAY